MTNAELISKIKDFANEQKELLKGFELQSDFRRGETAAYSAIIYFLSTLESEKTISPWKKIHTYTEEIHEGDMEKMLLELSVSKGEKRTKTALPDRIVDILESEKPMKHKDIDTEIGHWIDCLDDKYCMLVNHYSIQDIKDTALHFYEIGCQGLSPMSMNCEVHQR